MFQQKWTPWLKMQTASNLLQQLIDTSSHQNSSEIQIQIQIQIQATCCSNWSIPPLTEFICGFNNTLYMHKCVFTQVKEATFQRDEDIDPGDRVKDFVDCDERPKGLEQNHWLGRSVGSFSKSWKSCKNWQMLKLKLMDIFTFHHNDEDYLKIWLE